MAFIFLKKLINTVTFITYQNYRLYNFMLQKDKHFISFTKGVTWRIIGTLDTMMLSFIFTKSIGNALTNWVSPKFLLKYSYSICTNASGSE
jgi:hypothetical protein